MKIRRHKNLIREISPGEIVIGNNPFAPTLKLDELTRKAELDNDTILVEPDLLHISGKSINYETLSIISGSFENRPQAENKNILLEGDLDPDLQDIRDNLQNASGILNNDVTQEVQARVAEDYRIETSLLLSSGILNEKIEEESARSSSELVFASGILSQDINIESSNLRSEILQASGILREDINIESSNLRSEILQVSGILSEDAGKLDTKINQVSGHLETKIENIELEGGAVSYQQASDLAKKWAIILG